MIASPVDLLLTDLNRRGVTLLADDGRLRFHPTSAVDALLLERLRSHKAELLERLAPAPAVNQLSIVLSSRAMGATPAPAICNRHDHRQYRAAPSTRIGWESITCGDCGKWLGNRPVNGAKPLEGTA